MEAIIANMAWFRKSTLPEVERVLMMRKLTLIPERVLYDPNDQIEPIYLWKDTPEFFGVPRHWYKLNKKSSWKETVSVSDGHPIKQLQSPCLLREDDQEPEMQQALSTLRSQAYGGGLVNAFTGWGKTSWSIELARRLCLRTLILVHKEPLMNQWVNRIKSWCPEARVGILQGPDCEYENNDFVVGMIQSIMNERGDKYPQALWKAFGLVFADECHIMGADSFSSVLPRFNARYKIGLSATLERADKCENAFRWELGELLAQPSDKNRVPPFIYVRNTGMAGTITKMNKQTGELEETRLSKFKKPTLLGFLQRSKHRNALIAKDILDALKAGRSPLVMSERLEILDRVAELVSAQAPRVLGRTITSGFYIGGKTEAQLEAESAKDVVYATLQLAREGIDIQRLDTLFLCTPVSNPIQIIGRVGRNRTVVENGKAKIIPPAKTPMVVDYVDHEIGPFKGSYRSRLVRYAALKFKIIGTDIPG